MFACVIDRPREPVICFSGADRRQNDQSSLLVLNAAVWKVAITAGEAFGTIAEVKDGAEDRTLVEGFWRYNKSCDMNIPMTKSSVSLYKF